jgi:phage tail-like protein
MSKLPGTFTIFPRGPKPKSTAPHGQRKIEAKAAPQSPQKQPEYHQYDYKSPPVPAPRKALEKPAKVDQGDPWNNHYFAFELDGEVVAHFQESTGFKTSLAAFEIEEGGRNNGVIKRPGQSKWSTVTLKFAVNASNKLAEWRDTYYQDGFLKEIRPNCVAAIIIKDLDGMELRRYSMTEVWPVSWEGPSLNSTSSGIALDTLEIGFDQVVIGGVGPKPGPGPTPTPTPVEQTPEPIQFDFDKSNVKKSEEKKVDDASKIYKSAPAVWVEGHTCDLGSHSYNLKLSTERAQSVAASLQDKDAANGIKREAYNASGHSYDFPVKPNKGETNRAANRRCQVWPSPRSGRRSGEIPYVKYS